MRMARKDWPRIAGIDCFPPHHPPPETICSEELCQAWLLRHAQICNCPNEHAHGEHYWWDDPYAFSRPGVFRSGIGRCVGRTYCEPKFFPPGGDT